MNLRVLGCHGGASRDHRNVSFLVDGRLALDAGNLAGGLTIEEQAAVEVVLVTHAHLDHVSDLGAICDNRAPLDGAPLLVIGLPETLAALRAHFFNGVLWPDFSQISSGGQPTLGYREIAVEEPFEACGLEVTAVPVDHSVPSCGFVVGDGRACIAYSGDTGPTERFWEVVDGRPELRALITEVSFPDAEDELARVSGHLTPATLRGQLERLARNADVPVYLYGMKPAFVERIRDELGALDDGRLHELRGGEVLEF